MIVGEYEQKCYNVVNVKLSVRPSFLKMIILERKGFGLSVEILSPANTEIREIIAKTEIRN